MPSMAEISYAAGDQQAGANANWKMFTEQINAYTNINNANRLQSLREKEFARQIVENDRKFDLLSSEQDSLNRSRDIQFETSKYALEQRKKADDELANAWNRREEFQKVIDLALPLGGEDPSFAKNLTPIFRQAKNQSDFVIINEILKPYLAQNKLYRDSDLFSQEVELRSGIERGLIDIPKEEWAELQELKGLDETLYRGRLNKYRADLKLAEVAEARQREKLIRAEAVGQAEAEALAKGATEFEITVDEKGNIVQKAKTPRPSLTGRGATGGGEGAGAKTLTSMADTFQEMGIKAAERAKELKEAAESATDELEKKSLQIQSDAKLKEAEEYNNQALEASRAARTGIPSAGGAVPAVQSGLPVGAGARGVLAPSLRDVKKTSPSGTPTPAPAPAPATTPTTEATPSLESTLSPAAQTVLGATRVGGGIARQAIRAGVSAIPGVGRAVSLAETAPAIVGAAQTAGAVGRELSDYASSVSRAERAARARAAKGESFDLALIDEQRKIIEELSRKNTPPTSPFASF